LNRPGLTNTTTKAIVAEFADRAGAPWSDWILATLQEGRVHTVGTATAAVETFIAAALRAVRPDESAPELRPAEWMVTYLDHARDVLGVAVTDARNDDLPDVAERTTRVREALEAGAEAWRQQERQSMIATPLAPEKVSAFREQTREALAKSRIVPDLLRLAGAITPMDAPPDDPPVIQWEQAKAFFTADGRFVGLDMIARDIGMDVAHSELRTLIEPMTGAEPRMLVADGGRGSCGAARPLTRTWDYLERIRTPRSKAGYDSCPKSWTGRLLATRLLAQAGPQAPRRIGPEGHYAGLG
jgi:hypothetical protein